MDLLSWIYRFGAAEARRMVQTRKTCCDAVEHLGLCTFSSAERDMQLNKAGNRFLTGKKVVPVLLCAGKSKGISWNGAAVVRWWL